MSDVKIANLTPHTVSINVGDKIVDVENSGFVLRVSEKIVDLGEFKGIKVIKKELDYDKVDKETIDAIIKYAKENDFVIVSLPCKDLIKCLYEKGIITKDVASKYYTIGDVKRDNEGKIICAVSLSKIV